MHDFQSRISEQVTKFTSVVAPNGRRICRRKRIVQSGVRLRRRRDEIPGAIPTGRYEIFTKCRLIGKAPEPVEAQDLRGSAAGLNAMLAAFATELDGTGYVYVGVNFRTIDADIQHDVPTSDSKAGIERSVVGKPTCQPGVAFVHSIGVQGGVEMLEAVGGSGRHRYGRIRWPRRQLLDDPAEVQ